MLLLPSSPPCVSVVWGCLVYYCSVKSCAVWVSGMLCPPSSQVMAPLPPCVHWYLPCWLVGCWFSGCLVGCWVCWLVVGQLSLAGWLVGWLVGWLRGGMVVG